MIKIYSGVFDTTPIDTIDTYFDIEIKEDISWTSFMQLSLSNKQTGIKRGQKIQFFEIKDWQDVGLFEGYIDELSPWLDLLEITAKDFKDLMQKKLTTQSYNFVSKTLQEIVESIVSDWNSTYSENWTVNSNFTLTISKDIKQGDNFYDIFNELSETFLWAWTVKWNEIFFSEIIWEDKTSWSSFTEIIYNKNEPVENNLSDIKVVNYGTISNIIYWTDWTNVSVKTNPISIANFWPLSEYRNFREGNLSDDTQKYLDIKSEEQLIYDISPDVNAIDVDLWDKIKLRIENVSEYLDIEWDVIVNTKETTFEWNTKIIKVWLSKIYVTKDEFTKKINDTKKTINILKLS